MWPMAKLTSGALRMSQLTMFEDLDKHIGLQELPDGPTPSGLPGGPTTGPSGPVPAPASPSPSRGKARARQTNDISGLSSTASFQGADRLSYSVSRSLQQSGRLGSTECSLIWKVRATPAGRLFFQLVPSMRPIGEIDFGLWRTPTVAMLNADRAADGKAYAERKQEKGQTITLVDQVHLAALWPMPTSLSPAKDGNNEAGNSAGLVAIRQHALAMWATPSARDWKDTPGMAQTGIDPDGSTRSRLDQLPRQVAAALWNTPVQDDTGMRTKPYAQGGRALSLMTAEALGAMPSGSSAQTEKPGALDPKFVSWLMGFPPSWLECAPTSMPKQRKK
jgi:hypothetical protein